jgi:DNA (cytosine-5)-methyltransferase 1
VAESGLRGAAAGGHGMSFEDFVEMDSGLLIPHSLGEDLALAGCRPKAVDFFSGAGGFSLGFMQAGFEVVAAVDNEPHAAITYTMNLGRHPMQFVFIEDSDRTGLEKALTRKYKKADRHQLDVFETSGSGWIKDHPAVPGVGTFFLGDIRKLSGRQILDHLELEVGELDAVIGSPPCQGYSFANGNVPGITSMRTPDGFLVLDLFCQILQDGNFAGVKALRGAVKHHTGITLMREHKAAQPPAKRHGGKRKGKKRRKP